MTLYTTLESPVGTLLLTSDSVSLTRLYMNADPAQSVSAGWQRDDTAEPFNDVSVQIAEYFVGDRKLFDFPIAPAGTDFQKRVWEMLQGIPYGQTMSYGEIAIKLGAPNASRAVGLANGKNPIGIVIPCHRVIGADGKLVGYAGGVDRKLVLLELERRMSGLGQQSLFG